MEQREPWYDPPPAMTDFGNGDHQHVISRNYGDVMGLHQPSQWLVVGVNRS